MRPGSGEEAQRRAGAGGQQRGAGTPTIGCRALSDLVDAAIARSEPAAGDAPVNRVARDAGIDEIGPAHHPVLPSGYSIDDNVGRIALFSPVPTLTALSAVNVGIVRNRPLRPTFSSVHPLNAAVQRRRQPKKSRSWHKLTVQRPHQRLPSAKHA